MDVTSKYNFQLGVGVEAEYRIHEKLGFALGINYVMQGIKTSSSSSSSYLSSGGYSLWSYGNKYENEEKLKTLRVPLLLCLHPLSYFKQVSKKDLIFLAYTKIKNYFCSHLLTYFCRLTLL